uniref:Phenylalanine tRNA synthetase n=1 Tax=Eucheuma denticulatum TaxID=305493 RepID=A0A8E7UF06_9FLOR|nr:phenylalanine tRNA synthetase [Eucheuma denticulatum]
MKFSWRWLNKIIDLQNKSLGEVIDKLTLAGFEIDDIEYHKEINDTTINVSITSNRADTMSIIGLARELSTILNIKFLHHSYNQYNFDVMKTQNNQASYFISNNISDLQLVYINNVKLTSSPKWLQDSLIGCGITPKYFLFDICQYINIKWGQDIEIFDTKAIDNNKFDINLINITNVLYSPKNEQYSEFKTIKKNISLEGLKYKNQLISIPGFESNSSFHCKPQTSSIIILGTICKPNYIQNIVQILKYKTEKSCKHIKSISRNDFAQAYEETINLILKLVNYNPQNNYSIYYKWHESPQKLNTIAIAEQNIYDILGPINNKNNYLAIQSILQILQQLQFQPEYKHNTFFVKIPEHRYMDIQRPIDVIEEIGRIYGFNHFNREITTNYKHGYNSQLNIFINKLRLRLRDIGLHEVIHYSLVNKDNNKNTIKLHNPLLVDQTHLRYNLINNLLNNIIYNNKQTNVSIECFEIGRIFRKRLESNNIQAYSEDINLAGVMGKNEFSKTSWSTKGKMLNWLQAKGLLENLFEYLHMKIIWEQIDPKDLINEYSDFIKISHCYRCAILKNQITKEIIGIFTELNIQYRKQLKKQHRIYIFELNVLKLIKAVKPRKHLHYSWQKYSNYPSTIRDISIILQTNMPVSATQNIISSSHPLIESVKIFNEYHITNHLRSISFRITYRSYDRTLNDYDIQDIDNNIQFLLKQLN